MSKQINISGSLSVHEYRYGTIKVAFLTKHSFGPFFTNDKNMERIANYGKLDIHLFETTHALPTLHAYSGHAEFTSRPDTRAMYDDIFNYITENNIKIVIIFGSGYPYSEEFINKLKGVAFVACYFGDDPEGSDNSSKPYVRHYDYAFCGGLYADENTLISQNFLDWGAPKAKFIPLGANPSSYADAAPDFHNRDVDVVYIGTNAIQKFFFLAKLKRHFGDRMRIYGKWYNDNPSPHKSLVIKFLRLITGFPRVDMLPENEKIPLYRRTKVGINFHLSYGPSNLRSYELPMNGVMQIADNEKGYSFLYELGKEIICYRNKDADEAIRKIEYYLSHEDERIRIAKAGYKRVSENYLTEMSFKSLIDEILAQEKTRRLLG